MEQYNIYEDIAERTQGAVYIGVVGPVRTGKSTFIKRFSEKLLLPVASEEKRREMRDELPQSAKGKTIMTTEPKFVPSEPIEVRFAENSACKVRLIDCVGFPVEGALGDKEDGVERLVNTPWQEGQMPFSQAAVIGTEKVIREHSSVAVLVTTDGSITEIARENYVQAEEKTVAELKALGKPFVILLNCKDKDGQEAKALEAELTVKYGACVSAVNVEEMDGVDFEEIIKDLLLEFPVCGIDVNVPEWMRTLPQEDSIIAGILEKLRAVAPKIEKMKDCSILDDLFTAGGGVVATGARLNLKKGLAEVELCAEEGVYMSVLSARSGRTIENEEQLLSYVTELAEDMREYEKIKTAFTHARDHGYGIVPPDMDNMVLEEPRLVRQGGSVGIALGAKASTYHIVKVDVSSSATPIVGGGKQGEEYAEGILESCRGGEEKLWEVELFGRSLASMASDGLLAKCGGVNENLQRKLRRTLFRIVNEGKGNFLCIMI